MDEKNLQADLPPKKAYASPVLKEWGSIAEITKGEGGKWKDVDLIWDATSEQAIP